MKKINNTQFQSNSESGFSLVSALVAAGIASIVAVGISNMMSNTFKLQKKSHINDERMNLFNYVRNSISCESTYEELGLEYGKCGTYADKGIDVYRDDQKFLDADGSMFGDWSVKAFCRDDSGLDVRVAYMGGGSSVLKDPLTKEDLDYNHPKNIISPIPCSEGLGGNAGSPDMECVTGKRQGNTIKTSKDGVITAYNRGIEGSASWVWGMTCDGRYNRMSCALNTPTNTPQDSDVTMPDKSCASDNDEWNLNHSLMIVCCRLNN